MKSNKREESKQDISLYIYGRVPGWEPKSSPERSGGEFSYGGPQAAWANVVRELGIGYRGNRG